MINFDAKKIKALPNCLLSEDEWKALWLFVEDESYELSLAEYNQALFAMLQPLEKKYESIIVTNGVCLNCGNKERDLLYGMCPDCMGSLLNKRRLPCICDDSFRHPLHEGIQYMENAPLPECVYTQREWEKLQNFIITESPKLQPKEYNEKLRKILLQLKAKHPGHELCLNCGEEIYSYTGEKKPNPVGLCRACYTGMFYKNKIRYIKNTRGYKVGCKICGRNIAVGNGLCRKCFFLQSQHGIKNTEELREFVRLNKGYKYMIGDEKKKTSPQPEEPRNMVLERVR